LALCIQKQSDMVQRNGHDMGVFTPNFCARNSKSKLFAQLYGNYMS